MSTVQASPAHPDRGVLAGIVARLVQIGVMFALIALLLFGGAGTLDWPWAWLYLAIYLSSVAVNGWFLRHSAELVAERGRPAEAMRTWDGWLGGLWAIAFFFGVPLIAGLDHRFGWTGGMDLAWHVAGAVLFAAGLALFSWAMIVNAWFSTAARIQQDRGQSVCREGPYRVVRHPGYAGTILQSVGVPMLLGSAWALAPAAVAIACMVGRTWFEDRMLRAELRGYADYAAEVRQRIVPRIW